jgi:hypothetical protein
MRMDDVTLEALGDDDGTDRSAIIMMLTYVEAECRRLGNAEAARHAAVAAALVTGEAPAACAADPAPPRIQSAAAPLN